MDATQILVAVLGGGTVGAVMNTLVQQWRISRKTRAADRRRETDRADEAERAERRQARWSRRLEESLLEHRRVIIRADCLGSEYLPEYPQNGDRID